MQNDVVQGVWCLGIIETQDRIITFVSILSSDAIVGIAT
jgi:hypothetical protein